MPPASFPARRCANRPEPSPGSTTALAASCLWLAASCAVPPAPPRAPELVPVPPRGADATSVQELGPSGPGVTDREEIEAVARQHAAIAAQNALASPGVALSRARRVFFDLVVGVQRAELPWQLHLIESPEPRSFSPGAGYLYLSTGLIDERGLVDPLDDAELAVVLAHEIAHVELQHSGASGEALEQAALAARTNPLHGPSFSEAQEGAADRLAALHLALAGYDPDATQRVWERAAERFGSNPGVWLREHPLGPARLARMRDAVERAHPFYEPNRRHPDWRAILARFEPEPRTSGTLSPPSPEQRTPSATGGAAPAPSQPTDRPAAPRTVVGTGTALNRALSARQGRPPPEASPLAPPSPLAGQLRVLRVETGREASGERTLSVYLRNDAPRSLRAVGLRVLYLGEGGVLETDLGCGGRFELPPDTASWLLCPRRAVPGALEVEVDVIGASFR